MYVRAVTSSVMLQCLSCRFVSSAPTCNNTNKVIKTGRPSQRQVLGSATQPNRSVGEMTWCPLGDGSLRETYATSDEGRSPRSSRISPCNHHASLPMLECESNSSSAGKWADSVQALWGRPVKIGLAKVQDLDATHTLEVELSF